MSNHLSEPKPVAAIRSALARYRVTSGAGFDLDRFASDDLPEEAPKKGDAQHLLQEGVERLAALQELLYANRSRSLVVVFQAMDAGGKDSTIKHVMSGVNPQGVTVTSFKAPSSQELAHGFLWRINRALPARGFIGIFNRSHYEDVLVSRVHPDLVAASGLPPALAQSATLFSDRIADIAAFEAHLARQGTAIVKLFLDVGRDEQRRRFLARLETPEKTWKFDAADLRERAHWPAYRRAYQAAIAGTASEAAPWYVIPADRKWYARLVAVEAICETLEALHLSSPTPTDDGEISAARAAFEAEEAAMP